MDNVSVFHRGAEDIDFIQKLTTLAGLTDLAYFNINIANPPKSKFGLAFGKVTGRLAEEFCEHLLVLPTLAQLQPVEKNRASRQQAWNDLQKFAERVKATENSTEDQKDWNFATITLGDKKICVYDGTDRPLGVEANIYMSKADSDLLLKMKEAFRADTIVIGEES